MPNLTQIPPQNNSYIKIPRAEILSLVGLTAEAAQKFAEEESHEFQRLKLSRQFGQEAYDLLKAGQKVAIVKIGSSQFPIEPAKTYAEFVQKAISRISEITPTPPSDEVKEMLSGFAEKALQDSLKDFNVAVACFNFVANNNLIANTDLIAKLKAAATGDQEKYRLAKALDQLLPEIPIQSPIPPPLPQVPDINPAPEVKTPRFPFATFKKTKPEETIPQVSPQNSTVQTNGSATLQPPIISEINKLVNQVEQTVQPLNSQDPNLRPVPPRAEPIIHLAQDLP